MSQIDIVKGLPNHGYPFVLVDRILKIEKFKRAIGYKNISRNEPWVNGHLIGEPVYPAVLMLETMAQIGGFIFYNSEHDENRGTKKYYLCGVKNLKIPQKVMPGDTFMVDAQLHESFNHFHQIKCVATVNDNIVASGILTLAEVVSSDEDSE